MFIEEVSDKLNTSSIFFSPKFASIVTSICMYTRKLHHFLTYFVAVYVNVLNSSKISDYTNFLLLSQYDMVHNN